MTKGISYKLQVVQQPVRARTCGFGDKDRRPISPPPFVRLSIYDSDTNEELDPNSIDTSTFVLITELRSPDETRNRSLVQESFHDHTNNGYSSNSNYNNQLDGSKVKINVDSSSSISKRKSKGHREHHSKHPYEEDLYSYIQPLNLQPPSKNLIGCLTATAFKLNDLEQNPGIWFIFNDLSIRSEGFFRLKFHLYQLSDIGSSDDGSLAVENTLAVKSTCYSNIFQVHTVKRFPGVIDSTKLSKHFASQGMRITARKEKKEKKNISN